MSDLNSAHLPLMPAQPDRYGIGVIGAGFIVCHCHLVAYKNAGFRTVGLTSRTLAVAREVAGLRGVPRVASTVKELLDMPEVDIVDVAVPPAEQPKVIREILDHPRAVKGILAQKPLAMSIDEARAINRGCADRGIKLQVNQNMRYDHSVRACKHLLKTDALGDPVLATIELRAIPHWMSWAREGRSLSTFIMSIHHLDTLRYWLGEPERVMASTRPDPRSNFPHEDGINLYILEFPSGARGSGWDDVWAGPAREGAGADISVRWRVEGTRGLALGTIGWPGWPARVPSTIDYSTTEDAGAWLRPRWTESWFPDAFAGTMAGLMVALENDSEPDISGDDNLKTIALCEAVLAAAREHRVASPAEFL